MSKTYGVSLNPNVTRDKAFMDWLDALDMSTSDALRYAIECAIEHTTRCRNGIKRDDALMAEIVAIRRMLSRGVVVNSEAENAQTENAARAEEELLAAGMTEEALYALKHRVCKPGMRLE